MCRIEDKSVAKLYARFRYLTCPYSYSQITTWPQDAAFPERLANGLFDTLKYAKGENDLQRRDALVAELRQLQQAWPQDAAVREQLASAAITQYYSHIIHARFYMLFYNPKKASRRNTSYV